EALAVFGRERVELLLHAHRAEGGDGEDLGLAALEKAGAVSAGQDADIAGDGPELVHRAAIGALALLKDALAQSLLDDGFKRHAQLGVVELALEVLLDFGEAGFHALLALFLDGGEDLLL